MMTFLVLHSCKGVWLKFLMKAWNAITIAPRALTSDFWEQQNRYDHLSKQRTCTLCDHAILRHVAHSLWIFPATWTQIKSCMDQLMGLTSDRCPSPLVRTEDLVERSMGGSLGLSQRREVQSAGRRPSTNKCAMADSFRWPCSGPFKGAARVEDILDPADKENPWVRGKKPSYLVMTIRSNERSQEKWLSFLSIMDLYACTLGIRWAGLLV